MVRERERERERVCVNESVCLMKMYELNLILKKASSTLHR